MSNYYISDTHFGHNNIISFDKRPYFTTQDMEQDMIAKWNSVVTIRDTVYILGDFCWDKSDEWIRLLDLLNGQKVLIKGNHDLKNLPKELKNKFQDICDYKEITDNGRHVIMSHYPILTYKGSYDKNTYMLHGHVHDRTTEAKWVINWVKDLRDNYCAPPDNCGNIYNVGCMMNYMGYAPRMLDEIVGSY